MYFMKIGSMKNCTPNTFYLTVVTAGTQKVGTNSVIKLIERWKTGYSLWGGF